MIAGRSTRARVLGGIGLYAAIAAYLIFALLPIYWTLKISVTPQSLLYSEGITLWPSRTTFENYGIVLRATDFPRYFLNSVIVSLSTAAFVTVIATLAGYSMSRFSFRGKAALAIVLLLTQTFPLLMVIPPIYRIMGQFGLINSLTGLIIIYTAFNTAFATFLMQSFFDGIPKDLEDAAMIDGCTRFGAFMRVVLPLSLPGLTSAFVLNAILGWSQFIIPFILLSKPALLPISVGIFNFQGTYSQTSTQILAAASVLSIVPAVIVFLALQRFIIGALMAGAVKG
jgi:multiple sugar transport system permease protein